jgi:hypothetical protein
MTREDSLDFVIFILILILLTLLCFATIQKRPVYLLLAIVLGIGIASLKIHENYSVVKSNLFEPSAERALVLLDDETCAPFTRLGSVTPDIIQSKRLRRFGTESNICYISLNDDAFDENRNPEVACAPRSKVLWNPSTSNLVENIYHGFVDEDDNGHITSEPVCFVKFNENAVNSPNATEQLLSYATDLTTKDPAIKRLIGTNTTLHQQRTQLQNRVDSLSWNLSQSNAELQRVNTSISTTDRDILRVNDLIKTTNDRVNAANTEADKLERDAALRRRVAAEEAEKRRVEAERMRLAQEAEARRLQAEALAAARRKAEAEAAERRRQEEIAATQLRAAEALRQRQLEAQRIASITTSTNGRCGPQFNTRCRAGECCSIYGWCGGQGSDHCGWARRNDTPYHGPPAPPPPPPPPSPVTIYQHCWYGGYAINLPPGRYNLAALQARGMRNDDISSVRVPRGRVVSLYQHDNFQGRAMSTGVDQNCLVNFGFNDVVSSIIVH